MESEIKSRNQKRKRRTWRVRNQVRGDTARPRLSVFRSNRHLSAQIIDDFAMVTLVSAGTQSMKLDGKSKEMARQVGEKLAALASAKGITQVVFDRGHRKFHGALAALADGARAGGLQF